MLKSLLRICKQYEIANGRKQIIDIAAYKSDILIDTVMTVYQIHKDV